MTFPLPPIPTPHGAILPPAFLPDATRAVVKGVGPDDLAAAGVRALVANVLHLSTRPGIDAIHALGGLHRFMGFDGPIATDSGGFQILSMIAENERFGSITHKGLVYRPDGGDKHLFTAEKSIQQQLRCGADLVFCLDHCTHPAAAPEAQRASVDDTLRWAERCRAEFDLQLERRAAQGGRAEGRGRPLLFAVVQGGRDRELRKRCAGELVALGFDGFGFGGWPIDEDGLLEEMVGYVAELLPPGAPKHALGVGKPENVAAAWRAGYSTFDSSYPTRAARRQKVFVAAGAWGGGIAFGAESYGSLHLGDERFRRDGRPLDERCPAPCCTRHSRAYLHHLFKVGDGLAERLATLHNLAFYERLCAVLRAEHRSEAAVAE